MRAKKTCSAKAAVPSSGLTQLQNISTEKSAQNLLDLLPAECVKLHLPQSDNIAWILVNTSQEDGQEGDKEKWCIMRTLGIAHTFFRGPTTEIEAGVSMGVHTFGCEGAVGDAVAVCVDLPK